MTATTFLLQRQPSPLGEMLIVTDEQDRLRALDWFEHEDNLRQLLHRQNPRLDLTLHDSTQDSTATLALRAYFDGRLDAIDHLDIATGGTDFQRQVWAALRTIPCGTTISYRTLAERIGRPKAIRAVGLANGANPISIVVPCHRVIGANHTLTGYGGGLPRKAWLLAHEGAQKAGGQASLWDTP